MTISNNNDIKALSNMSIAELKQLLSCVNQDLKSIKKAEKIAANNVPSEYSICNDIAKRFTGKVYPKPVENRRLKEDIQIQQDILDYLNNGKHIICHTPRKSKNSIKFKPFVVSLSNQVSL
jgi:hypothetical protein